MWPGLRAIQDCGFDILHHFNVDFPEALLRTFDISQSLTRSKARGSSSEPSDPDPTSEETASDNKDHLSASPVSISTVHSHTEAYLTTRCRLLHFVEQLRMLGMHFRGADDSMIDMPMHIVQDLAGNAIELTSVGVVFAACLVFSAVAEHRRALSSGTSGDAASPSSGAAVTLNSVG